jgi:hypothetical protein
VIAFLQNFPQFAAASWAAWRQILALITPEVREAICIVGRGGGKSMIAALIAVERASREYSRAPGEQIYVGVLAPDRRQAAVTRRYIAGLLRSVPAFAELIVRDTTDSLELRNGVVVEVITASAVAPRGRSYAAFIVEEAAFLPDDESANPDEEILAAIRPALARVPGSLLVVISSPYARRGVLYDAWTKYGDASADEDALFARVTGDVLMVKAPTQVLNPAFDAREIAKAYERDPSRAGAEYGARFRLDVENFISLETLQACTGRHADTDPHREIAYGAFVDPSGGSSDSFTLAIAHREESRVVIDKVVEHRPPFSPDDVVKDLARVLAAYRIRKVTGDRYAGEFPRELFRKHGIRYEVCGQPKSDLYQSLIYRLNSRDVVLLEHARLQKQLLALERRPGAGKDVIDHPRGGKDDLANVVAGVCEVEGIAGQTPRAVWRRRRLPMDPEKRKKLARMIGGNVRPFRPGDFGLHRYRGEN